MCSQLLNYEQRIPVYRISADKLEILPGFIIATPDFEWEDGLCQAGGWELLDRLAGSGGTNG
jgi:hypothetical protein